MNLKKLERYLRVDFLGPGPRLIKKKNLPGPGITKVEKHWFRGLKGPTSCVEFDECNEMAPTDSSLPTSYLISNMSPGAADMSIYA